MSDDWTWDDWPRSKRGYLKLVVDDATADRWIAAGVATEDDLIRQKPISRYAVFQSARREGKSLAAEMQERYFLAGRRGKALR